MELWTEEEERRMDVIAQNGNTAEHYEQVERKGCWTPDVKDCQCPGCGGPNE